ncbi:hypothetical protein MK079_04095 [Candidatus Gracilibacteria bacterium]|nr:hypothetical protein [Candidatus Gracilibacteria bacterium]
MKDTLTISLEKEMKQDFTLFAKSLGTNPTNLLCMMIQSTMRGKKVEFHNPNIELEIESFSDTEIKEFSDNFMNRTQKNTDKMEHLLTHV